MNQAFFKFTQLLEHYPFAQKHWDIDHSSMDMDSIKASMGTCSHGQQLILAFLVAVFTGVDHFSFNILEAAGTLDPDDIDRVCDWMKNPYWP